MCLGEVDLYEVYMLKNVDEGMPPCGIQVLNWRYAKMTQLSSDMAARLFIFYSKLLHSKSVNIIAL